MPNYNYASEIGLDNGDKRVSWPITLVILLVLAGAGWFALSRAGALNRGTTAPTEQVNAADSGATH